MHIATIWSKTEFKMRKVVTLTYTATLKRKLFVLEFFYEKL